MIAAIAASSSAWIGRIEGWMAWSAIFASRLRDPGGLREFARQQAGREQEALADLDPKFEQEVALRFGLHALGDQAQAQAAGDAGDGLADRHVGFARHALR
jgi:hypothetical protein